MAPPRKTLKAYNAEAVKRGTCRVHPAIGAARRCYELRHGKLGPGLCVCHRCDTPACIADWHHFVGTRRDNIMDAVRKGRHSCFQKLRLGKKGHRHSEEAKLRIGAGARSYWQNEAHTAARLDAVRAGHARRTTAQKAATAAKIWEKRRAS